MKIYLATDHAGFALKEAVKRDLRERGYTVQDEGAFSLNPADDYPDFIKIAAKQVSADPDGSRAIIFGGSGQGEAIVANRFPFVRAAVYNGGPEEAVVVTRMHNNSNVLSIGARFVSEVEAARVIHAWLSAEFLGEERHLRRIEKIDSQRQEQPNF